MPNRKYKGYIVINIYNLNTITYLDIYALPL